MDHLLENDALAHLARYFTPEGFYPIAVGNCRRELPWVGKPEVDESRLEFEVVFMGNHGFARRGDFRIGMRKSPVSAR